IFQAISNMLVAVNILPVTGQNLPFISSGGTSIWMLSLAIGMILSVSACKENEAIKVENLENIEPQNVATA
ncbi:MAG: FtsW/RodA/SpoVE family cell cycle protein, partial [Flavobacteriaceae bacterium]|nr:FtsW/RodA/SpoVE family cell cycle protein [Flavobacteriaceae bacterium]